MEEEQLTYECFIQQIINARGRHGCGDKYHEKHHIVPKCLGGNDDELNLVDLFAREHFIAHMLLAKENPHNSKLQYAWWRMVQRERDGCERYVCTPEEYEEARIRCSELMSEQTTGEGNPFYGKKHSKETRTKMSLSHKGLKHSDETKLKMRMAQLGEKGSNYGKVMPDSVKEKLRLTRLGRKHTEESKELMRRNHANCKGALNPRARAVKCIETGEVYWGAKDAEEKTGVNRAGVTACCVGRQKTAGGYHWEYVKD